MRGISAERQASQDFEQLKLEVERSIVHSVTQEPMVSETNASNYAIAATLSQSSRPVALFSRTLINVKRRHSAVEKEARAIVEAIQKWDYYLRTEHFNLSPINALSALFSGNRFERSQKRQDPPLENRVVRPS